MTRQRLDRELTRRGLARSRSHASELIAAGAVRVGGVGEPKPASLVGPETPINLAPANPDFASRGGIKLAAALAGFPIEVAGRRALDAGASTGGFTDCLLRAGVGSVLALDVGYGQLLDRIRTDERVTVRDRTNLRLVGPDELGGTFDLVVADLSFISLCTVAPALARLAGPGADLILLVKPQFEVGRTGVGKGGVVTDPELRVQALGRVVSCLGEHGIGGRRVLASPITGAKGNVEYLLWARRGEPPEIELVS